VHPAFSLGEGELRQPTSPHPDVVQPHLQREHSTDDQDLAQENLSKLLAHDKLLSTLGWSDFVRAVHSPCDFPANIRTLPHPAAPLLATFQQDGVPVSLATPATPPQDNDLAVTRGSHKSADDHVLFLQGEFNSMIKKGHWTLLPYRSVRLIPGLRISPMGVVPQRERRPRTIVDYSFASSNIPSVNADTIKAAPPEAMQFGKALRRILQVVNYADDAHGPAYLLKVDIADGFYRVWVQPDDVPKLGVVFPTTSEEPDLIAFPLALPMGWVELPPYFCVATETITDLANDELWSMSTRPPKPHRLEATANTLPSDYTLPASSPSLPPAYLGSSSPVACFDVYIDDFLGVCQGNQHRRDQVRRVLLHQLDNVFRPQTAADIEWHRDEPASIKKLKKGDGAWTTSKVILGWQVDTITKSVALPAHRFERLLQILDDLPRTKKCVSLRKWQQHVGELRSMSLAIPGSRGLFSLLHEAFRHKDEAKRVRLSPAVHDFLDDFRWLLASIHVRPTYLRELFPSFDYHLGACDASKAGMGGVWFPSDAGLRPMVWRQAFPPLIRSKLVSTDNPAGQLTNSDLELAGTTAHLDIATTYLPTFHQTLSVLSDNTPAVAWQLKGSTTTNTATAYLLRIQALHQRHFQYHPTFDHIAGTANAMADIASHHFDLSDTELLSLLNSRFPQTTSWSLFPLRSVLNFALESALLCKRPKPESFLPLNGDASSSFNVGQHSSPPWEFTPSPVPLGTPTSATPSTSPTATMNALSPFSPSFTMYAPGPTAPGDSVAAPPARHRWDLEQWKTPFVPLLRRASWLDLTTLPDSSLAKEISEFGEL
jgi:hypothetical protein